MPFGNRRALLAQLHPCRPWLPTTDGNNSEQQIFALLLVFHQAHNLSCNKCALVLANQPISGLRFFNPQQMFLLRDKLIMQGEKRETSTQTCNETMFCAKLRGFCISYFAAFGKLWGIHSTTPSWRHVFREQWSIASH